METGQTSLPTSPWNPTTRLSKGRDHPYFFLPLQSVPHNNNLFTQAQSKYRRQDRPETTSQSSQRRILRRGRGCCSGSARRRGAASRRTSRLPSSTGSPSPRTSPPLVWDFPRMEGPHFLSKSTCWTPRSGNSVTASLWKHTPSTVRNTIPLIDIAIL